MRSLGRRIRKLESLSGIDGSGLVPNSDAWFEYYEHQFERVVEGEAIGDVRIPLAVIDRIMEQGDSEEKTL